jgi:hypothetical protein
MNGTGPTAAQLLREKEREKEREREKEKGLGLPVGGGGGGGAGGGGSSPRVGKVGGSFRFIIFLLRLDFVIVVFLP